jgi:rubrerythrin
MALSLFDSKGTPLAQQRFTWKELVQKPISKLDDDAFTRVRVILMNGIETEAMRFGHACARMNGDLQVPLAQVRRVEQHQQTMVNWLIGADHSPVETTIGYEQVAIEVTAAVAQREPDPYLAQVYRFGMLEDFDHLYRYSALLDRMEGKDANNILQTYTDIMAGRPTMVEHRAPEDDVRKPYDRKKADALSKLHALTIMAGEHQTHDYYANIGPQFADPIARQLYAEIASIEEQHVTQYESIIDPNESWMEKWLLHEANEAYNYYGCVQQETNPRIRAIWERMLDYELGHVQFAMELFKKTDGRDPAEILPAKLPDPFPYTSNRDFVRKVLKQEVDLRAKDGQFVPLAEESQTSITYRKHLNSEGSPTESVAAGYQWSPGTELRRRVANM